MAAFEKINSGLEGLDNVLDHIRLGDNVVWQVSDINVYQMFAEAIAIQAIKEKKILVYIRFAQHKPLLDPGPGLNIFTLDADKGFENFTISVHDIIEHYGRETYYIFDCISELQAAWSADLMMGNFFVVTCPYLFELDTVAYFGILRGRHSFDTIARIRDTTQILIDAYSEDSYIYIHPLKVWKRYSDLMFLPHMFKKNNADKFETLSGGLNMSRFYKLIEEKSLASEDQNLDNWDRFFLYAKLDIPFAGQDIKHEMCERLIGGDKKILKLVYDNFEIKDFISIRERMIGSGKIGGKATGMLLARKIIENSDENIYRLLEPHDSFYIGSDVYYTYLVQNDCWKLRILQQKEEQYFKSANLLKEKIISGSFPETTKEQFRRMLEYYGQNPIIVRSSSLLEDSFENAFAGKYESIFCVNTGNLSERLRFFENAVKQVYASTMDESALEYRFKRGLDKSDEQMAILVQRVSGMHFDNIYMPCAAGVGYSYNSYKWKSQIDPQAGMVRIVMGLGTRAVDRTDGDYPRISALSEPVCNIFSDNEERSRYSQRRVDFLNLATNAFCTEELGNISEALPGWYKSIMVEHDYAAERIINEKHFSINKEILFSTCEGLLKMKDFTGNMRDIMSLIQEKYNYPVDIEFTCNFSEHGDILINILQCRPLQLGGVGAKVNIPVINNKNIFFELLGSTMGGAIAKKIDSVILVDPKGYYHTSYKEKFSIARMIGKLNHCLKDTKRESINCSIKENAVMLIVPGRLGTRSPDTGVPVKFAEISNFNILCEIPYMEAGYNPELSFGSHFFQDLVESGIFYAAIMQNESTVKYNSVFFDNINNMLSKFIEYSDGVEDVLKVYDTSQSGLAVFSDIISGRTVCGIFKQ
ncbi:MAG: phosphoenolpyruvate synthase [Actinobacteria bacterium]|nr:phosphoenolpyruvate synthase [Actinomycetota bacterium]